MPIKIEVKDRVPTYPGRVKMTPVVGQTNVWDWERADQPLVEGTVIDKELLDQKAYTLTSNVIVYVSSSGSDTTGQGTSTEPYATIQKAVDSIPKCLGGYQATIDIATGTYPERVRIEGFYGGRLIVGQSDRTVTTLGISVIASSSVTLRISNVTATGGDGSTLLYVAHGSNVIMGRHITLDCANSVNVGVGVEQNSTLTAIGVSVNVRNCPDAAILAKDNGRITLDVAGGSGNTGVGLRAENGSVITFVTRSISATTAYLTTGGGKIYSGAQSTIPNY